MELSLRHYVPLNILVSVYYSLFFSYTSYASQVENIHTNRILATKNGCKAYYIF